MRSTDTFLVMPDGTQKSAWQRLNRWTDEHPRLFVAAAAVLVCAVSLAGSAARSRCLFETLWMAAAIGVIAAACLSIAMAIRTRRQHT